MRGQDWKPAADAAMDRYACGDDAAFAELYDLLEPRLTAFLLRRTRDEGRTDDLVQQTFMQMHCARRHFARGAEVMPWAFAIARRLLIDSVRKGGRERELLVDDANGDALERPCGRDKPDSALAKRQLARRIEEELERMPEAHREAFDLIQGDGLSVSEAAKVLAITPTAVKLRAHRAYAALRERLGSDVHELLGDAP
ncbi:MAG TPA: RNA polymerase sigma factor [Polyangiaceae bacterium]